MKYDSGIYKITHRETGKIYIGQSIKLKRRYNGYKNAGGSGNGNSVIKRSILKYGWDAFDWEILLYANDLDYLNEMEIKLIKAYDCIAPKGFNIEEGGKNAPFPEHIKKLFSEQRKGKKLTQETKDKLSISGKKRWENATPEEWENLRIAASKLHKGKKISEETRKKLSESRLKLSSEGKLNIKDRSGSKHTEETKKKMSLAHKGQKRSEESKQRMVEASKKRWADPAYREKIKLSKMKKEMPCLT